MLYRLHGQIRKHQEIQSEFVKVEDEVMSLSGRFSIINSHAVDYINSLGPDIAHEIYHVQKILHAANAALAEAQLLLASEDISSLSRAQALLDRHFTRQQQAGIEPLPQDPDDIAYKELSEDWKREVEEELQKIGKAIASASSRATETGLPKRRKRQSTLLSLKQIGIQGAPDGTVAPDDKSKNKS